MRVMQLESASLLGVAVVVTMYRVRVWGVGARAQHALPQSQTAPLMLMWSPVVQQLPAGLLPEMLQQVGARHPGPRGAAC